MFRLKAFGVVVMTVLVAACSNEPAKTPAATPAAPAAAAPAPGAASYSNGLTNADRQEFYHLSEGGELYPMAALLALEYDGGDGKLTPFTGNLERYGLIPDAKSDANPFGLPIGISVAPSLADGSPTMGLNCTACHVGQITSRGKAVRIDGAPSMVYVNQFLGDLVDQTKATMADGARRRRFLFNTFKNDVRLSREKNGANASLRQRLTSRAALIAQRFQTIEALLKDPVVLAKLDQAARTAETTVTADNKLPAFKRLMALRRPQAAPGATANASGDAETAGGVEEMATDVSTGVRLLRAKLAYLESLKIASASITVKDGYGRVDAFDIAHNLLFAAVTPGNLIDANAPASFPHMWSIQKVSWLQWGANMNSVMERNIGQSLGVGAVFDGETFDSTSNLENLNKLEHYAYKLTPPVWPADVLGPINEAKAERGRSVYTRSCANCHEKPFHVGDTGLVDYRLMSLQEVGTDPALAVNFDTMVVPKAGAQAIHFGQAAFNALEAIKKRYYETHAIPDALQAEWEQRAIRKPPVWAPSIRSTLADSDKWPDSKGRKVYPARPLAGIWSTAPYLHNGSVPTLLDLLTPSHKRPKTFSVGTREYDPVTLGYVEARAGGPAPPFTVDTSIKGNLNTGHVYGTNLPDADKMDLIEFLKKLGPNDFPPAGAK